MAHSVQNDECSWYEMMECEENCSNTNGLSMMLNQKDLKNMKSEKRKLDNILLQTNGKPENVFLQINKKLVKVEIDEKPCLSRRDDLKHQEQETSKINGFQSLVKCEMKQINDNENRLEKECDILERDCIETFQKQITDDTEIKSNADMKEIAKQQPTDAPVKSDTVPLESSENLVRSLHNETEKRKRTRQSSNGSGRDSDRDRSPCSSSGSSRGSGRERKRPFEVEDDAVILARRQKQIDYGKNTIGYDRYIQQIPKERRNKEHPKTPPKHLKYSRRAWDGLVKMWRQQLHLWDPKP